jgi:hypothetical protein
MYRAKITMFEENHDLGYFDICERCIEPLNKKEAEG